MPLVPLFGLRMVAHWWRGFVEAQAVSEDDASAFAAAHGATADGLNALSEYAAFIKTHNTNVFRLAVAPYIHLPHRLVAL